MNKPMFDVCYKAGSYKDKQGNEKTRWIKLGTVWENDKGMSVLLDAVPAGATAPVWLSLFPVKDRQHQPQQDHGGANEDSVPF
jgi:hypothetical protein